MRRRSLIIFVIINVFVSLGVVLIVLSALNPPNQGGSQPILVTVPLIITATEDPNTTPEVIIITATPRPGEVILPDEIQTEITLGETGVPIPTIDATLLESSEALRGTTTAMPTNCIPYVLQEGDTPFAIAVEYDVDPEEFMAVNGLDDETASFLQIGQVLIVPLAGCELTSVSLSASQTATYLPTNTLTPSGTLPSPSPTASVTRPPSVTATRTPVPNTPTPSRTPTATIPPTAENAQVEIVQVHDPGNVTAEGVEIRNNGPVIDLSGWTLTDGSGSTYTFPNERRLFQGGQLTVYSRVGEDTAVALFWDRTESVWSSGAAVTLLDDEEQAQSVYQIP